MPTQDRVYYGKPYLIITIWKFFLVTDMKNLQTKPSYGDKCHKMKLHHLTYLTILTVNFVLAESGRWRRGRCGQNLSFPNQTKNFLFFEEVHSDLRWEWGKLFSFLENKLIIANSTFFKFEDWNVIKSFGSKIKKEFERFVNYWTLKNVLL